MNEIQMYYMHYVVTVMAFLLFYFNLKVCFSMNEIQAYYMRHVVTVMAFLLSYEYCEFGNSDVKLGKTSKSYNIMSKQNPVKE